MLNLGNARLPIFEKDGDYEAFERILEEALARTTTQLLASCLMPNHCHLVILPKNDGELSQFTGWLTLTHTQRWHAHRQWTCLPRKIQILSGSGRCAFSHGVPLCRANALRANLVRRAEEWPWSSLWRWAHGDAREKGLISTWPVRRSANWVEHVNSIQSESELAALRRSVQRGCPLGDETWSARIVRRLGLESTLRPQGRPKKSSIGS